MGTVVLPYSLSTASEDDMEKIHSTDRSGRFIEEMREIRSLDVLLPARDKTIRLRVVSTPSKELRVLLQRKKIQLPNRPKIVKNVENVVQKIA